MDLSPLSALALPAALSTVSFGTGRPAGPGDARLPAEAFASLLAGQTEWLRADPSDLSAVALGDPGDLARVTESPASADPKPDPADPQVLAGASIDAGRPAPAPPFGEAHPGGMTAWLAAWTPPPANPPATASPASTTLESPVAFEPVSAPAAGPAQAAVPARVDRFRAPAPVVADRVPPTVPVEAGPAEALLAAAAPAAAAPAVAAPSEAGSAPVVAAEALPIGAAGEPSALTVPQAGEPVPGPVGAPALDRAAVPLTASGTGPADGAARWGVPRSVPMVLSEAPPAVEATPVVAPRDPDRATRDEPAPPGLASVPPGAPVVWASASAWARSGAAPGPRAGGDTPAGTAPVVASSARTDTRAMPAAVPPAETPGPAVPSGPGTASPSAAVLVGLPMRDDAPSPASAEPMASGPGTGPTSLAPEPVTPLPTSVAGPTAAAAATPMASPVTELNLPTPVHAPEFTEALGLQVSVLARDGIQEAELHLNPAEMGPISVRIALDGPRAQVDFGVDSAATRALVEAGLPELAAALRESGLTLTGGGVSQHARGDGAAAHGGRPGEGSQQPGAGQGRHPGGDQAPADDVPGPRPRTVRLSGGVDLYA